MLAEAKELLASLPGGKLRIVHKDERTEYYLRKDGADKNGSYINKNNASLIPDLSWRSYLTRLIPAIEREIMVLDKIEYGDAEDVYADLKPEFQQYVTPLYPSDDELVKAWMAVEYRGLPFTDRDKQGFYTQNGIRVRSKSEMIIADRLSQYGIPFRYEYPLTLKGKTVYPDFTCLKLSERRIVIHEHLGLMDDAKYQSNALRKMSFYEESGLRLGRDIIYTMETADDPLDVLHLERMIEHYLL